MLNLANVRMREDLLTPCPLLATAKHLLGQTDENGEEL